MKPHNEGKVWSIEVLIDEDDVETEAKALLRVGDRELVGWGRARPQPA